VNARSAVLFLLVVNCSASADEATAAGKLLDQAIEALGGAKVLKAGPVLSGTSKGTSHLGGKKHATTNEWIVAGLDRMKWNTELTLGDTPSTFLIVVGKDGGWIRGNGGAASDIAKAQLDPFRQGFRALRLAEWLIPLKEKGYTLSSLGELKVEDKPALGIQAKRKDTPDLDLWFDKKTYLPVKAELRIKETDSREATYVALFGDYKTFGDRKCFTKLTIKRDDELVWEMQRSDITAKESIADETFAKP
jgi:hypothetical protein